METILYKTSILFQSSPISLLSVFSIYVSRLCLIYLLEHVKHLKFYKKNAKNGWLETFRETMRTQIASALGTLPYNLMVEQVSSGTAASEGCMQATVFFIGMTLYDTRLSRDYQYRCKSLISPPTPTPTNTHTHPSTQNLSQPALIENGTIKFNIIGIKIFIHIYIHQ